MNTRNSILITIALVMLFIASSCKNEDPEPVSDRSNVAQPVKINPSALRGLWKTVSVNINSESKTNEYSSYRFELSPNNELRVKENSGSTQVAGGNWSVSQDSMRLTLNFTGNEPKITTLSGEYALLGFSVDLWTISRNTSPNARIQFSTSK